MNDRAKTPTAQAADSTEPVAGLDAFLDYWSSETTTNPEAREFSKRMARDCLERNIARDELSWAWKAWQAATGRCEALGACNFSVAAEAVPPASTGVRIFTRDGWDTAEVEPEAASNAAEPAGGEETGPVTDAQLRDLAEGFKTQYQHASGIYAGFDNLGYGKAVLATLAARLAVTRAGPAGVEAVPEKWIFDPHDIEQGMMLNPEWLKLYGLTAQQAHQQQQTPAATAVAPAVPAGLSDALSVDCPHCWQKAGEPCIWPETRESNRDAPHEARKAAALAASAPGAKGEK